MMNLKRKMIGAILVSLTGFAAFAIVAVVFFVMGTIIIGGWDVLSWEFVSAAPSEG